MSWQRFAERRDRITSKSGGWTIGGEATLYGYNIHQELLRNTSWMQSLILAVTGRLYPKTVARFIEAVFVATGYPDPRLWCNRIAALAGNAQCPAGSALAVGIASAEGNIYGGQAEYRAAKFLIAAHRIRTDEGEHPFDQFIKEQIKEKRVIYGYGRPLTKIEERIEPIEKFTKELNLPTGDYLLIAREIEEILKPWRMILNYGGYVVARLLDLGFSAREIHQLLVISFFIGLQPCYIEAFENEPGTFLPIACEDIVYEGVDERPIPE